MAFVARRLEAIQPSPTMVITNRARELRAAGRDVIEFGAVLGFLSRHVSPGRRGRAHPGLLL